MSFLRFMGITKPSADPLRLVLYTRKDCPLCDVMKAEIERANCEVPATLEIVDVETDAALVERYGLSIPVLTIEGRVAFKGRLTAGELARKLSRSAKERARG